MSAIPIRRRPASALALVLALVAGLAACSGPATTYAGAPGVATPSATARAASPAAATPATPARVGPGAATPATPGVASGEVTPDAITVGAVTLRLALGPGRHMFDQAVAGGADPVQPAADRAKAPASAVFAGGMLRVTNNFDPTQAPPADTPQALVRHVAVQVQSREHGEALPYLDLTLDVLLDGRPVLLDQGLAPMVAVDGGSPHLYYGNNIKFPQRGTYQLFLRLQRNALLGPEPPPAAQFNLTLR